MEGGVWEGLGYKGCREVGSGTGCGGRIAREAIGVEDHEPALVCGKIK